MALGGAAVRGIGTLGKITMVSIFMYLVITIFMYNTVVGYWNGSAADTVDELGRNIGVSVSDGAVVVTPNATMPEPSTNITTTALQFLAPVIAVWDWIKAHAVVFFVPVLMLMLPDTIVPLAVKVFVLLPLNFLTLLGIVALIRGYDI